MYKFVTASGKSIDLMNIRPDQIELSDIAASLSKLCRFAGHTSSFYSVAEHSVLVARNVPIEYALEGLLHDAAEAYVADLPLPVKILLPNYVELERRVELAITEKFSLDISERCLKYVKAMDLRALSEEFLQLMPREQYDAVFPTRISPFDIGDSWRLGLNPGNAEKLFLEAYSRCIRVRN